MLDTLSHNPRNYFFNDLTFGNPQSWYWDFGDGSNSTQQNPVYQYAQSGIYQVCLEVMALSPNGGLLGDTHCAELSVPDYFDIGGLAFIGNTPLNNPFSTGDTGIAYLYRKYDNLVVPVDTNYFYEYGYYWFSDVREGNHIVKVALTESSQNFTGFAPAYHLQQLYWQQADIIAVQDSNNYYANIYLPELTGSQTGIGSINGNVVDLNNPSLSDYVDGQPVFLYSESGEMLSYALTNIMGSFTFGNLALGTYELATDVTGYFAAPVTITLDQSNPAYNNVLLMIGGYIGIDENKITGLQCSPVYPNPLNDWLNMDLIAGKETIMKVEINNLLGQKVYEELIVIRPGKSTITLSTEKLEKGIYFITLSAKGLGDHKTYKFLKK